jgi:hypothetical protein
LLKAYDHCHRKNVDLELGPTMYEKHLWAAMYRAILPMLMPPSYWHIYTGAISQTIRKKG